MGEGCSTSGVSTPEFSSLLVSSSSKRFRVVGDKVGLFVVGVNVGFIVDVVDGGIDGEDDRDDDGEDDGVLLDKEMDGASEETWEGLFVTATLGFIDVAIIDGLALGNALAEEKELGAADCASLGEFDSHGVSSSDCPKSTFISILLVPILLPFSPAKATTALSNVTTYSVALNPQHSSELSTDSTTKRYAPSLGMHCLDAFFSIGGVLGMTSLFWR